MRKICIIVGHGRSKGGGYDSGAVSKDGKVHEFRVAREIARCAVEHLKANYSVEADIMNYNGNLYLTDRIKEVNKSDYDFVAEIHLNAGGGKGTEVFYYHDSPTGLKVANEIAKEISSEFSIPNRGAKVRLNDSGKDYFAIIRDTKPCAVLVETVFIDNESELNIINTTEGHKRSGSAIARGIATAMNLKEKEVPKPADKKVLYRVQVGAYANKSGAEAMKAGLEKLGFEAIIVEA